MASAAEEWHQRACARVLPLFVLGEALGAGTFGIVVHAQYQGTSVALKCTDKSSTTGDPRWLHRVRTEARVLKKLEHPNIIRCFGAVEDAAAVALVLSREDGQSMEKVVAEHGVMAEAAAAPVVLQLARALRHMHQRKIAHRDIKLDNLMYDAATGRVVLIDFGLALAVRTQGSRLDVKCGSAEYLAPELIDPRSKGYYGPAVDMWAVGVLAYVLLCAHFPFGRVQTKICRGSFDKAPLRHVGSAACEFIGSTLVVDPNSVQKVNRCTSADACRHPWLSPHEAAVAALVPPIMPTDELCEAVRQAQAAVAEAELAGAEVAGAEVPQAVASAGAPIRSDAADHDQVEAVEADLDDGDEDVAGTGGTGATAQLLHVSLDDDDGESEW